MSERRRDDIIVAFEVIAFLVEATESAGDVIRHTRFFRDDQRLSHLKMNALPTGG